MKELKIETERFEIAVKINGHKWRYKQSASGSVEIGVVGRSANGDDFKQEEVAFMQIVTSVLAAKREATKSAKLAAAHTGRGGDGIVAMATGGA